MYHEGSRDLQDRFDTRRLADRIDQKLVHGLLNDHDRAFVERMDMFFLATADAQGRPICSYKGGAPGFVHVLDERTVAFPAYDGNGMFLSLGNVAVNPNVSMLFVDFVNAWRMRIDGRAELILDDQLVAIWSEAKAAVRVTPRAIYPQCPRYIHKMNYAERSQYVPQPGVETPVPDWKRADWAADVLAADDPARVDDQ